MAVHRGVVVHFMSATDGIIFIWITGGREKMKIYSEIIIIYLKTKNVKKKWRIKWKKLLI